MKKSLIFFACAAFAASAMVSCQTMEGETSDPADSACSMNITVGEITDDACTFTIAPAGQALYYSYVVEQTSDVTAPDADDVYSCAVDGLQYGTIKYADAPSTTIELTDLDYNTDYVIFAVAGSPTGNAGVVAAQKFHTSDTVLPELDDVNIVGNSLVLSFTEDIQLPAGLKVTVEAFAASGYDYQSWSVMPSPRTSFTLENGEADGCNVSYEIPEDAYIPGALLAISYPEGLVTDAVGNKCEEVETTVCGVYYSDGWYREVYGVAIETDPEEFELGDLITEEITSLEDEEGYWIPIEFNLGSPIGWYYYSSYGRMYSTYDWQDEPVVGSVIFSQTSEAGRTSYQEFELTSGDEEYSCPYFDWNWNDDRTEYYGLIYLAYETPIAGDTITITIPEGAYTDEFGRNNAEKTYEVRYNPTASAE